MLFNWREVLVTPSLIATMEGGGDMEHNMGEETAN